MNIHTHMYISVFSNRYGGCFMKPLCRGACEAPIKMGLCTYREVFTIPLYRGGFVKPPGAPYSHTFSFFLQIHEILHEAPIYRGLCTCRKAFVEPLGLYTEGALQSSYTEGALITYMHTSLFFYRY